MVVNVPATTANLGPGFDSFGFALDVWNRVTVERADKFSLTVLGEGSDTIDTSEKNIVVKMCRLALKTLGQEMPPLQFECQNAVPPTRGMGELTISQLAAPRPVPNRRIVPIVTLTPTLAQSRFKLCGARLGAGGGAGARWQGPVDSGDEEAVAAARGRRGGPPR